MNKSLRRLAKRSPPPADLATELEVNKNTVIRALHIVRDAGNPDFTRGRSVRVVGGPQQGPCVTASMNSKISHEAAVIAVTTWWPSFSREDDLLDEIDCLAVPRGGLRVAGRGGVRPSSQWLAVS